MSIPFIWKNIKAEIEKTRKTQSSTKSQCYHLEQECFNFVLTPIKDKDQIIAITHIAMKTELTENVSRNQERLRLALLLAEMGVWDYDFETKLVAGDDSTCRLLGLPNSSVLKARYYLKIIHPNDLRNRDSVFHEAIRSKYAYSIEYRIIWPDKSVHWIYVIGKVVSKNNRLSRMLGVVSDITQRKNDEKKLKKALNARDDFLQIVSHELKTPITAFKLQLYLIAKRIHEPKTELYLLNNEKHRSSK